MNRLAELRTQVTANCNAANFYALLGYELFQDLDGIDGLTEANLGKLYRMHEALSLSDLKNKIKDTLTNLKSELPGITDSLVTLLNEDVTDIDSLSSDLKNIVEHMRSEENKVKDKDTLNQTYKFTVKTIQPSELTALANKTVAEAVELFVGMFGDNPQDNIEQYWKTIKAEAVDKILTMDSFIRSRFVPLVQNAAQQELLKLISNKNKTSSAVRMEFTAAELKDLGFWSGADINGKLKTAIFKRLAEDLNPQLAVYGFSEDQLKRGITELEPSLFSGSNLAADRYCQTLTASLMRTLKQVNPQTDLTEPILLNLVTPLLSKYITEPEVKVADSPVAMVDISDLEEAKQWVASQLEQDHVVMLEEGSKWHLFAGKDVESIFDFYADSKDVAEHKMLLEIATPKTLEA